MCVWLCVCVLNTRTCLTFSSSKKTRFTIHKSSKIKCLKCELNIPVEAACHYFLGENPAFLMSLYVLIKIFFQSFNAEKLQDFCRINVNDAFSDTCF